MGRSDASFIAVNGTENKVDTVLCLETMNDSLIVQLDMHSKVGLEIDDPDVGESL